MQANNPLRLTLVSPPFGQGRVFDKGLPIVPPVLEYLAGLTEQKRPGTHTRLIDAHRRPFHADECEADLAGISVMTPQAPWAYATADALRARGIPVVLGGVHVSMLPDEAELHADAIVIGEAESVWGDVLAHAATRRLEKRYVGCHSELTDVPRPTVGLLPDFYPFGSFFTSRGCPHSCSFCSVHTFLGHEVRQRPIGEVVAELAASPRHLFFNLDDNCWGPDSDRALDLFGEMSHQLRFKWWFGQADLATAQRDDADELLAAARRAGLFSVMVGYESHDPVVLEALNASSKQGRHRLDSIRRIRSHGIDVVLFVQVGSRAHHARDFESILALSDKLNVAIHPVLTVPYPGTDLRAQYEPYIDGSAPWDLYDGSHALFTHDDPVLTPRSREEAAVRLRAEIFSWPRMLRRISGVPLRAFPRAHLASMMVQFPQGMAFRMAARDYLREMPTDGLANGLEPQSQSKGT